MDLENIALDLAGPTVQAAVARWIAELQSEDEAEAVLRHLRAENDLPMHPDGLGAVGRLVDALASRAAGRALNWYRITIEHRDLACQGREASASLPDDLCKLVPWVTVWDRYRRPDTPIFLPGSTRRTEWLKNAVSGPAYRDVLDPHAVVSGRVPAVFATFEEDREVRFPQGTPAAHAGRSSALTPATCRARRSCCGSRRPA